jgi:hydrogenase expression/formation protein HypE
MEYYPLGKLPADHLARLLGQIKPSDPRVIAGGKVGQDAALIKMGDRCLAVKTDPITFATDEIGWYAVNINANDIACTGAVPRWFLATLLLPENSTTPALVDNIFTQIQTACADLGISLIGGHTEITHGLNRPLVIGNMLGEVLPENIVTTAGAQPGDDLILTKGIAIEGTAIIAGEMRSALLPHFAAETLDAYANFLHTPGISVVKEAAIATAVGGIHAMHDPTEGGIATGLHELAQAAQVGLQIFADKLPYLPETMALCRHFGLEPLGLIASGALLIAADPQFTPKITAALAANGLKAAVIGNVTPPENGIWLMSSSESIPLPTFDRDEIARLFET